MIFAVFLAVPSGGGVETADPGAGLGLAPGPERSAAIAGRPLPRTPHAPGPGLPAAGFLGGAAAIGAAMHPRGRRRPQPPQPVKFVYVPGHGGDPDGFADLAAMIGVTNDQVAVFDYRWVWRSDDPIDASRWARTSDAADALHAQLATLASSHDRIYVVAHSKGGAIVTEMLSRWDERPELAVGAVAGAMLLDPAIAAGPLGLGQSLGWLVGEIPDDGGFHPVRCGLTACRDIRVDLGRSAGVDVVAIRNPDAVVTNFRDRPAGLRVHDLDDDGPHPMELWMDPIAAVRRVGEAHSSVLHDETVAACLDAEANAVGSCRWPEPAPGATAHSRGPRNEPEAWPNPDVPQRPLLYWGFGESNGPSTR